MMIPNAYSNSAKAGDSDHVLFFELETTPSENFHLHFSIEESMDFYFFLVENRPSVRKRQIALKLRKILTKNAQSVQ